MPGKGERERGRRERVCGKEREREGGEQRKGRETEGRAREKDKDTDDDFWRDSCLNCWREPALCMHACNPNHNRHCTNFRLHFLFIFSATLCVAFNKQVQFSLAPPTLFLCELASSTIAVALRANFFGPQRRANTNHKQKETKLCDLFLLLFFSSFLLFFFSSFFSVSPLRCGWRGQSTAAHFRW